MGTSRDVMDAWLERGILGLVLGILILGPLALGAVMAMPFLIIQAMTCAVLLVWGIRLWLKPRSVLLWPPICWAVLAIAVYAVARYAIADIEYLARQETIRVLVYAALFLAIVNNLSSRESTQAIVYTLIFLAMVIAGYAVYQFLSGSEWIWHYHQYYKNRASGTYISPNHLAGFLEMILPLSLAYALTSRAKALTRIFIGYAALVILAGIAVTVSRGGWLATVCSLILFFSFLVLRRGYTLPVLATVAVLVIGAVLVVPKNYTFKLRLKSLVLDEGRVDDDLRFGMWEPAWRMWQDHPWLGVGPNHFNTRFRQYRPPGVQRQPDRVHNDYLNTLADYGLVGFGLVSAAWVLLGVGIYQTSRVVRTGAHDLDPRSGSDKFALMLGASSGLAALLVHSLVDFNMHIPANAILAATLMALLSTHLRFASERHWIRPRLLARLAVTLAILAGLAALSTQAWQRTHEEIWLARAEKASGLEKAELLKKAFAADPRNGSTAYAIGELYRTASQQAGPNYDVEATEGMAWFDRALKLNRWDGYAFLRYGQCLDWLDRQQESGGYFDQADLLDPNGYYTEANVGIHFVSLENYAAARPWFERSLVLEPVENDIAANYLRLSESNLLSTATLSLRLLEKPKANPIEPFKP